MMIEGLVSIPEAAKELGVPKHWVNRNLRAGNWPAIWIAGARFVHLPTIKEVIIERARFYNLQGMPAKWMSPGVDLLESDPVAGLRQELAKVADGDLTNNGCVVPSD